VSGSGISWAIMQVCTSLQTDNHTSTPPLLCFLQAGCRSCRPTNSVKALKAKAVYLLLSNASYYLHSPSTTSGARYRYGHVEACLLQHWLNFSTALCTMRLISVDKGWKHELAQTLVTANTCCDVACLTFQLPHITTSSCQSHRRQPTTGSIRSFQHLKERRKPSVR